MIRGLTPDSPEDEPWQLVVEDITKPAFMQAPASSKEKEKDFKAVAATPDELDILVTSKNHDLKSSVASRAVPGDWLFALVTLQTMEGFGGAGNYGVSRMNGGFGSRPAFTLAPVEGLGAHLRMDILTLLDQMGSLAREFPMRPGGIGLVWTVPWDGARVEELLLERLHPFYIEVCRRIRLRPGPEGNLAAVRTSSKAARIEARNLNGRTGDPWTPVNTKDGKSLTLASGGFRYDRVVDYFSAGDWKLPVLWNTSRSAGANTGRTQLVARAMVRGQGQTAGYHERVIPLRPRTVRAFGASGGAADLETIARGRIEKVRIVQRILSHAIQVFLARGEDSDLPPEGRRLARLWLDQLDKIVDARFFEDLQDEFDLPDQAQRREKNLEWQRWLGHDPSDKQWLGLYGYEDCPDLFYGGAAGPGKTSFLLMAAVQYVQYPHYRALILRKTVTRLDGGVGCSAFALASVVFENLNHERRHVGAPVERFDLEPVVELAGDPAL